MLQAHHSPIAFVRIPLMVIIVFSGCYLTRLMPISPVYLIFIVAFITLAWGTLFNGLDSFNRYSLPVILYIFYLFVTQPFIQPDTNTLLNVLFSLVYLMVILNWGQYLQRKEIVRFTRIFILFSIALLLIEAFWRITHPVDLLAMVQNQNQFLDSEQLFLQSNNAAIFFKNNPLMERNLFYAFKFSSIMFQDSNFVGTYAITVFFLYLYLLHNDFVKSHIPLYTLGVITILTLSRSAILTIPLTFILIRLIKRGATYTSRMILLSILLTASIFIFVKVATDESFISKFRIFNLALTHLIQTDWIGLLSGVGYGNSVDYIGIGAHNLFLTHLLESGILGLLLFLFVNLMFIPVTQRDSLYITIPLFISGLSLSGHAISFYYTALSIVYLLKVLPETPKNHNPKSSTIAA